MAPAVIGLAAAALLGAVSLAWWLTRSSEPPTQYKYTQITFDTGHTPEPALSPDDKLLAYASDRVGFQSDIYVQALSGGKSIPLTNHEAEDYRPSFSPDGSHIVFVSDRNGGGIFVVPALGGNPRKVADKGDCPRYSPDGEWISYSQEEPDRANLSFSRIYVASASGGATNMIETGLAWAGSPIWSPDGKQLLFLGSVEPRDIGRNVPLDWWTLPIDGGQAVSLNAAEALEELSFPDHTRFPGRLPPPQAWQPDGNRIFFNARVSDGATNLWVISISAGGARLLGEPQHVTVGNRRV